MESETDNDDAVPARGYGTGLEILEVDELQKLVEDFFYKGNEAQELTLEEFIKAFRAVVSNDNVEIDNSDLERLFLHIDANASGAIDWYELAEYFSALTVNDSVRYNDCGRRFKSSCLRPLRQQKEVYHKSKITKIKQHPTMDRYYTASEDGSVKCWSSGSLEYQSTIHNGTTCCSDMVILPKSDLLAVSTIDSLVTLYHCKTGKLRLSLKGKRRPMPSASLDVTTRRQFRIPKMTQRTPQRQPKGTNVTELLQRKGGDLLQRMWAAEKVFDTFEVTVAPEMVVPVRGLGHYRSSGSQSELLLTGHLDGVVRVFDVNEDTKRRTTCESKLQWGFHKTAVTSIQAVQDKDCVITAGMDSDIHVVHIEKGVVLKTLHGCSSNVQDVGPITRHQKGVLSLDYSSEHKMIVSVGLERHALVWNPFVPTPLAALSRHMGRIVAAEFNSSDNQIITLATDDIIRIWDVRTYRVIQQEKERIKMGTSTPVGALMYDPRRDTIITADTKLFKRPMLRVVRRTALGLSTTQKTRQDITHVIFSKKFNQIITASSTRISLWDFGSLQPTMNIDVAGGAAGVCLDSDERRLVVASTENSGVQVWNCGSGQLLRQFIPHEAGTSDVGYNDAGVAFVTMAKQEDTDPLRLIIVAGSNTVRIYRDSEPSNYVWKVISLRAIGGAACLTLVDTSVVLGSTTGKCAVLCLDTIHSSPRCRLAVTTGADAFVSLRTGPIHPPVPQFIINAENALHKARDTIYGAPPFLRKSLVQEGIQASIFNLGRRMECMVWLPWTRGLVVSSEGSGLLKIWNVKNLEQVLTWSGVYGDQEAIYAIEVDLKERRMFTGDEVGYLQIYDLSEISDETQTVGPEAVKKVKTVRCCENCITVLKYIPKQGCTLFVGTESSVIMLNTTTWNLLTTLHGAGDALGIGPRCFHPGLAADFKHTASRMRRINQLKKELVLSFLEAIPERTLSLKELALRARTYSDVFDVDDAAFQKTLQSVMREMHPEELELDEARLIELTSEGDYYFPEPKDSTKSLNCKKVEVTHESEDMLTERVVRKVNVLKRMNVFSRTLSPNKPVLFAASPRHVVCARLTNLGQERKKSAIYGAQEKLQTPLNIRKSLLASSCIAAQAREKRYDENKIRLSGGAYDSCTQGEGHERRLIEEEEHNEVLVSTETWEPAARKLVSGMEAALHGEIILYHEIQLVVLEEVSERQTAQQWYTKSVSSWKSQFRTTLNAIEIEKEGHQPCDVVRINVNPKRFDLKKPRRSRSYPRVRRVLPKRSLTIPYKASLPRSHDQESSLGVSLNEEFQHILELSCNPQHKAELLTDLNQRFTNVATPVCKTIVDDVEHPVGYKRINPIVGRKWQYYVNGISYKLVTNPQAVQFHGSTLLAMKAAKVELRALQGVARTNLASVPLCCVVSYKGHRLFVSCSITVDEDLHAGGQLQQAPPTKDIKITHEEEYLPSSSTKIILTLLPKQESKDDYTETFKEARYVSCGMCLKPEDDAVAMLRHVGQEFNLTEFSVTVYEKGKIKPGVRAVRNFRHLTSLNERSSSTCETSSLDVRHLNASRTRNSTDFTSSKTSVETNPIGTVEVAGLAVEVRKDPEHHRLYITQASNLLPCQPPRNESTVRRLGPKVLKTSPYPLLSCAYYPFAPMYLRGQADRKAAKVWKRLYASVVPDLASEINTSTLALSEMDGGSLLKFIKDKGMTCHQLGVLSAMVEKYAYSDNVKQHAFVKGTPTQHTRGIRVGKQHRHDGLVKPKIQLQTTATGQEPDENTFVKKGGFAAIEILNEEILGRAFKDLVCTTVFSSKHPLQDVNRLLKLLCGTDLQSQQFWSIEFLPFVKEKYEETPAKVRQNISMERLVRRIAGLAGLQLNPPLSLKPSETEKSCPDVIAFRCVTKVISLEDKEISRSSGQTGYVEQINKNMFRNGGKPAWETVGRLLTMGRASAATKKMLYFDTAIEVSKQVSDVTHARTMYHVAMNLHIRCPAYSADLLEQSLPLLHRTYGAGDSLVVNGLATLGSIYALQRRWDDATSSIGDAVGRLEVENGGESSPLQSLHLQDKLAEVFMKAEKGLQAFQIAEDLMVARREQTSLELSKTLCTVARAKMMCVKQGILSHGSVPAIVYFREALTEAQNQFGALSPQYVYVLNYLGAFHQSNQSHDTAFKTFAKSLSICENLYGTNHTTVVWSYLRIAQVWNERAMYNKALPMVMKALEASKASLGPDNSLTLKCYTTLAAVQSASGNTDGAIDTYHYLLELKEKVAGKYHRDTAKIIHELAGLFKRKECFEEALNLYQLSSTLCKVVEGCGLRLANSIKGCGDCHTALGNQTIALGKYKDAVQMYSELKMTHAVLFTPVVMQDICHVMLCTARILKSQGRYGNAVALLEESLQMDRESCSTNEEKLLLIECRMLKSKQQQSQDQKAKEHERQYMLETWLQGVQDKLCKQPQQSHEKPRDKVFLLCDKIGDGLTTL